jgi:hypothetical protein
MEEIKDKLRDVEAKILDQMGEDGISSCRFNGASIFIRRDLFPKIVDGDHHRALLALKDAGLVDLIKTSFDTRTLGAFIRERDRNNESLPEAFTGAIEVSEKFSIGVRNAGTRQHGSDGPL